MTKLSEIKRPISLEINEFESYFRDVMKTDIPLLNMLVRYILRRKGKQMRSMLVFLTAKLLGQPQKSTYTAAALIEILHTASLIHDDVVDDASERRGFFSVNAIWKSKVSVLLGDYLLAKGLLLAMKNKEYELLEIVSDAVREMSEGELLQIKYTRGLNITEEDYLEVIRKKTATLISSCSACGAHSVGSDAETVAKMKRFGELLGISFQIKDDLFDFQNNRKTGKPSGNDLKEKKLTLPLIHALTQSGKKERNEILRMLSHKKQLKNNFASIVDFVERNDGLAYANLKMNEYSQLALKELDSFQESEAKNSLAAFVHYTTTRNL